MQSERERLGTTLWTTNCAADTSQFTLDYSQCDLDIGEMFLNFLLNDTMKEMPGVDVQHVRSREASDLDWENNRLDPFERWCRNWMGLRDSPYSRSIQLLIRLKIEACGD